MGTGAAVSNATAATPAEVAADAALDPDRRKARRQLGHLGQLFGGGNSATGNTGAASGNSAGSGRLGGLIEAFTGGSGTSAGVANENIVGQSAGTGATSGLPTCADDGTISMTFYQVSRTVVTSEVCSRMF